MFTSQHKLPIAAYLKQAAFGVITLLLGIGIGMMSDGSGLRPYLLDSLVMLAVFALLVAAIVAAVKAIKRSPSGSFGGWFTVMVGVVALLALVGLAIAGAVVRPDIPRASDTALAFVSALAFVLWAASRLPVTRSQPVSHQPPEL